MTLLLLLRRSFLFAVEPVRDNDYAKISLKFRMFSPYKYSIDNTTYETTGIPFTRDPQRKMFRDLFDKDSPEYFSLMQSEKNQLIGNIWLVMVFGCITGAVAVNTLIEKPDDDLHSATIPLIGAACGSCAPTIIFRIRSFNNLKHAIALRERRLHAE